MTGTDTRGDPRGERPAVLARSPSPSEDALARLPLLYSLSPLLPLPPHPLRHSSPPSAGCFLLFPRVPISRYGMSLFSPSLSFFSPVLMVTTLPLQSLPFRLNHIALLTFRPLL